MTRFASVGGLIALAISFVSGGSGTVAQDIAQVPEFTKEFLADPNVLEIGQTIWAEQCTLCHGARAYPGKAPKLRPKRYTPEFVYRRVTKGFRAMPAWDEIYGPDERMAVAAYVMDKSFSP